jgi:hypothetical protein
MTFHLSRNMVRPGETLLMTASGGKGPTSVGIGVVKRRVSSCIAVGVGTPPRGYGVSSGTETRSLHVGP